MKRILFVDDDQGVRRLAGFVLKSAGFDVEMASDGRQALDLLDRMAADVVVLDLNMPVMDGYALFRELDHHAQRPPVLIISGDNADRARRDLGADGSLRKPFRPDELVNKVTALSGSAI